MADNTEIHGKILHFILNSNFIGWGHCMYNTMVLVIADDVQHYCVAAVVAVVALGIPPAVAAVVLGIPPAVALGMPPAVALGMPPAVALGMPPAVALGPPAVALGVVVGMPPVVAVEVGTLRVFLLGKFLLEDKQLHITCNNTYN